jgi:GNAT superfamily N-acetyltransferase
MTYRISEVDPHDDDVLDELRTLHTICFGDTAPMPTFTDGFWWLAHHVPSKETAGFAGMRRSVRYLDVGYLERCGVVPEHQGNRLQVRLLRARERKAKRLGWVLTVTDTTDNVVSANSLIKAGYRMYWPKVPWGLNGALSWRKVL